MSYPEASSTTPAPSSARSSAGARPSGPLVLGVDLTAAGARPGAHRARGTVAARSFDGQRFVQLVRAADAGGIDLITLDEGFLLHPGRRQVAGRLDAAVAAARVAPHTTRTGLVAAVDTAHVEPAHVARAVARVDQASAGRAGWHVALPTGAVVQDEAWAAQARAGVARVVQHWEGSARRAEHGAAGGVTVDGEGRFRVDHDGIRFAVRARTKAEEGPRQGRPPVVVSLRGEAAVELAARHADVVRIAATAPARAISLRTRLRAAAAAAGRDPDTLRVLTEAYVVLAEDRASAQARLELVEALEGPEISGGLLVVAGTADDLARTIVDWWEAGASDGFLLRPSSLGPDLDAVVGGVVPRLERAGVLDAGRGAPRTLRTALGLPDVAPPDPSRGRRRADRAPAARLVRA